MVYNFIFIIFILVSFSLIFLIIFNPVKNNNLYHAVNYNNAVTLIKPINRDTWINKITKFFVCCFFILCMIICILNAKNTLITL